MPRFNPLLSVNQRSNTDNPGTDQPGKGDGPEATGLRPCCQNEGQVMAQISQIKLTDRESEDWESKSPSRCDPKPVSSHNEDRSEDFSPPLAPAWLTENLV